MVHMPFNKIFGAVAVAAAMVGSLPAQAAYDGLVFSGDSLTDSGNNFIALRGATTPNAAITGNSFIP